MAVGKGGQLGGFDGFDRVDVELRQPFEAGEFRIRDAAGTATLGPLGAAAERRAGLGRRSVTCLGSRAKPLSSDTASLLILETEKS